MNLGRGATCLAAVCALVPSCAQAAAWTADPSLELSSGANDNYGLAFDRRDREGSLSMTGGLVASRETENTATRLNAGLAGLLLRGDRRQNEWQDSVAVSHTLKGPVDTFSLDAKTTRDETLQTPSSSADLLIGRGLQRNTSGDARWDRRFTERLDGNFVLGVARARYSTSLSGAHDYQNGSASASLRYLLDERDSVTASLAHQDYRTLDDGVRVLSDSLTLGGSRALSETGNVSATVGAYRSRSSVLQAVLACRDNVATCSGGNAVVVAQVGHLARWGLQYNASADEQLTERTRFEASAARQQDPSGAGVTVLSDTWRAAVAHAASETLHGSLTYTRASSRYQGIAGGQASRLQTLAATLSKDLSTQVSLRATADYKRAEQAFDGARAHAAGITLTLRYEWQRLEARH